MTGRELRTVERAASREQQARAELELAISRARAAGHSLRPIADAAGRSVEFTRQVIQRRRRCTQ